MSRLAVLKDELGRNIDHHTFVLKRYEDRLVELGREDAMQR